MTQAHAPAAAALGRRGAAGDRALLPPHPAVLVPRGGVGDRDLVRRDGDRDARHLPADLPGALGVAPHRPRDRGHSRALLAALALDAGSPSTPRWPSAWSSRSPTRSSSSPPASSRPATCVPHGSGSSDVQPPRTRIRRVGSRTITIRARRGLLRAANRILDRPPSGITCSPCGSAGKRAAYAPKEAFERHHDAVFAAGDFTDEATIKLGHDRLLTRYHYNAVENAILEHFLRAEARPNSVLDVGSGAGHWIDFYRRLLGADRVVGTEISAPLAAALAERYAGDPAVGARVRRLRARPLPRRTVRRRQCDRRHVPRCRRRCLELRRREPGVGACTRASWSSAASSAARPRTSASSGAPTGRSANKRIRSLRAWKACAAAAGLEVVAVHRARKSRRVDTPENNVLVLAVRR